jgi:hypothetical protein
MRGKKELCRLSFSSSLQSQVGIAYRTESPSYNLTSLSLPANKVLEVLHAEVDMSLFTPDNIPWKGTLILIV